MFCLRYLLHGSSALTTNKHPSDMIFLILDYIEYCVSKLKNHLHKIAQYVSGAHGSTIIIFVLQRRIY